MKVSSLCSSIILSWGNDRECCITRRFCIMKKVPSIDVPCAEAVKELAPVEVCMHMMMRSRNEVRAMRAGAALVEAGFEVSMVDIETERTRPAEEIINGVRMKHMVIPDWFTSRSF